MDKKTGLVTIALGLAAGCGVEHGVDMDGTAMFCVRQASEYPGTTELGIAVDANLHMIDKSACWIRKIGVRAYGDSVTEYGAMEFSRDDWIRRQQYRLLAPNNLAVGQVDNMVVYAVNCDGDEAEFGLEQKDCETLDDFLLSQ
ncbi:MAG: hypothetical protein KJ955_07520 [Nanoarchaeota archaeon]|nr:hypothetical protein [Nanoarchaeota archaeon]